MAAHFLASHYGVSESEMQTTIMNISEKEGLAYPDLLAHMVRRLAVTLLEHEKNDMQANMWQVEGFLTTEEAESLFVDISDDEFPLDVDPKVFVHGKECSTHRRTRFFSDHSEGYRFAGQIALALPLDTHPLFPSLLKRVNEFTGCKFNGILVNHYRDGTDYIGKHRDSTTTLYNGVVAAVSIGEPRIFRVRDYESGTIIGDYPKVSGSLMVMDGDFQEILTHEIPVQKKVTGGRISLTFRYHTV